MASLHENNKTGEENQVRDFLDHQATMALMNTTDGDGGGTGRNENLAKVEITVLSIILVIAIVGNGLMLVALRRQLKFRPMSRMYFFMLNLSIADLLVAFGNILPQLAWDITYRFKGPDFLCRIVKFLQVFVLYLSSYVLTSMAVDRYLVVCHHSFSRNHYSGLKGPKILVIASWILSIICAIPQAFIFTLHQINPPSDEEDCWATFIEPWGAKAYVTWFVISAFILPLLIIGASYGAICIKVIGFRLPKDKSENKRGAKKFSVSTTSADQRPEGDSGSFEEAPLKRNVSGGRGALKRQISQAKIKTLKLTLVVVICFFICWAPFCVTQLILAYGPNSTGTESKPITVIILLLASLNACTNPWIYLAFSESLFNQLRICLGLGLRRGSDEESIGDEQSPEQQKKKKPQKIEHIEIAKAQQPLIRGHSSIGRDGRRGEGIQPETKSDIL